ncbi:MAG: hypothetical protein Q8907_06140 [Bacteroidota bacterium]|nr:hypothetical protein [Bacteroidota bacterium]
MEHDSKLVPRQMFCQRKKAKLKFIPFNEAGRLCHPGLPVKSLVEC